MPGIRRTLLVLIAVAVAGIALVADDDPISTAATRRVCAAAACLESRDDTPVDDKVLLIMVHGWNPVSVPAPSLNSTWNNFFAFYARDASLRANFKPYIFSYNSNAVSVAELGRALRDVLDKMDESDPAGFARRPIVLVAHSMGGLVVRYALRLQQNFGPRARTKVGERVLRLITLGTPHHGSPLANGPAVEAKAGGVWRARLTAFERAFYTSAGPDWHERNRSDLRWDNYDGLLDYARFPGEKNPFLTDLNKTEPNARKIVAYGGSLAPRSACGLDKYCSGSTVLSGVFRLANDGVVPLSSAFLYSKVGLPQFTTRLFSGYNNNQIASGKPDNVLFTQLKKDLLAVVPSFRCATVNVPATAGGTDLNPGDGRAPINTGLTVTAGERFTVTASGRLTIFGSSPTITNGPDGLIYREAAEFPFLLSDTSAPGGESALVAGALVGRVGTSEYFYLGSSKQLVAPRAGSLLVGINDIRSSFFDNIGSFQVQVCRQ